MKKEKYYSALEILLYPSKSTLNLYVNFVALNFSRNRESIFFRKMSTYCQCGCLERRVVSTFRDGHHIYALFNTNLRQYQSLSINFTAQYITL